MADEKSRGGLMIVSNIAGRHFCNKIRSELGSIAKEAGTEITSNRLEEIHFANSEIKSVFENSVRGGDVYIVQDAENSVEKSSVNDNLMALLTGINAAHCSDAHYVTAVIPVFPYARQDRRQGKEGITAALVAKMIKDAGADRIIAMDIHNPSIAGFADINLEDLHFSKHGIDYMREKKLLDNLCVISPDEGGFKKANHYAKSLGTDMAVVHKERNYSGKNSVEKTTLLGDVKGKNVLIVDDMVDTGGTLNTVIKMLKEEKGCEKVYYICGLPLFNGEAIERIDKLHRDSYLEQIISSDAVYHGGEEFRQNHPWFKEVSVAKYFARVIYNINHYKSLSALLK